MIQRECKLKLRLNFVFFLKKISFSLAKSEFASISQIIANCFRGEIASTYFIPAEHRSIAKGKLWNSYMNYRTQLSQAGLIKRRPRGIKPLVGGTTSALIISEFGFRFLIDFYLNDFEIIETENDMDQDDDDLNFIRVETSPWEDVRKSWNNTFFSRMKFLNEYSTENYFNSFPCLKDEQGYELVSFFLYMLPSKYSMLLKFS